MSDRLADAQHREWLDNNPHIEAAMLLRGGRPLRAYEIICCCGVLRGDKVALIVFPAIREDVLSRWGSTLGDFSPPPSSFGVPGAARGDCAGPQIIAVHGPFEIEV